MYLWIADTGENDVSDIGSLSYRNFFYNNPSLHSVQVSVMENIGVSTWWERYNVFRQVKFK